MSENELQDVNDQIQAELHKWEKIGAVPKNIEVDGFLLDAFVNALVLFLVEKDIMQDEEFTLFFKKHLLNNLTNARTNFVEPAFKEFNRQQIINGLPNMHIPKQH